MAPSPQNGLSFEVDVGRLPRKGQLVRIAPGAVELSELSARHDLLSAEEFVAELKVAPWQRDGVRVSGEVRALVTQACVVTLEPVRNEVRAPVDTVFVPETSALARKPQPDGELLLDPAGEDPPETFAGRTLDVGALAEEFLELALDPYPRAPGADLAMQEEETPIDDHSEASPFRALAQLKRSP